METPWLMGSFVQNYVLPFLLVFTIIFAILQKTKLLGEEKKQIDAIVALIIGLFLIAFPFARNIIAVLMPYLAVAAVILLIFMLLFGFASGKEKDVLPTGLKVTFGILIGVSLIVVLIYATGQWDRISSVVFSGKNAEAIWLNVLIIAVIAGAFATVLGSSKKKDK